MKIKALFSSIPLEQFSPERQQALSWLLKQVNDYLAPYAFPDDQASLVELHKIRPELAEQALVAVFETGGIPEQYSTWSKLARGGLEYIDHESDGCDLIAGWIMDGGSYKDAWRLMSLRKSTIWIDDMAKEVEENGLHLLMFKMNLKDTRLALKAVGVLSEALLEGLNNRREPKGPLDRMSMSGFIKDPGEPFFGTTSETQYHSHFFDPFCEATDERIARMVHNARCDYKPSRGDTHGQLAHVLKNLIYNPGLRILSETGSALDVMAELDPVVEGVRQMMFLEPYSRFSPDDFALFKRQVFINLFSPFPHILAQLEAKPSELSGHPDRVFDQDQGSAWVLSGRNPIEVMKGPLASFGSHQHVYDYFKHQDLPIDLDWVLEGLIDTHIFRDLLCTERRCELISASLRRIAEQQEVNDGVMSTLRATAFQIKEMDLDDKAYVGAIYLVLEVAQKSGDDKPVSKMAIGSDLDDYDQFASRLRGSSNLRAQLLTLIEKHPNLLSTSVLDWCGYDQGVLSQLSRDASRRIQDEYFSTDLGL